MISDPDQPARIRRPFTSANGTAVDFARLMELADKHAVRFAKVMTCLNIGCPLGMGIWEGVPLREVIWLTDPIEWICEPPSLSRRSRLTAPTAGGQIAAWPVPCGRLAVWPLPSGRLAA